MLASSFLPIQYYVTVSFLLFIHLIQRAAGRGFAIRVCMGTSGLDYKNVYMTFPELLAERGPAGASDNVPLGQVKIPKA